MESVARRVRVSATLATLGVVLLALLPHPAQSQDFPKPERRKVADMLSGVRKEIADDYYDSTFKGLNLSAVYDSAADRIASASALDMALSAVAWMTLEFHDSHTFFVPPQQTTGVDYGWTMAMIGDSCFVMRVTPKSDAEAHGVHAGDRVLSFNGYKPTRENLWQLEYIYHVLRPQRNLRVVLQPPGGEARDFDLAAKVKQRPRIMDVTGADGGRDIGQLIRDEQKSEAEMKSRYVDYLDKVVVWKLPEFFVGRDEIRDVIKHARYRKSLVLDLRGDGGGAEQCLLEIIRELNKDSVAIGTLKERRKQTPFVAKGSGKDAFDGQLFVLVDSRSASASEIFARVVQLTNRGRVLGDRTMGAVMRSRLHVRSLGMETTILYGVSVTEADVIMADGGRLENVGVVPDEIILPTGADLAAGRDEVLARALTLAGAPTDAAKAGWLFADTNH